MLYWSLILLVIALIAGAIGIGVLEGAGSTIALVLFVAFLIFFVISFATSRRVST